MLLTWVSDALDLGRRNFDLSVVLFLTAPRTLRSSISGHLSKLGDVIAVKLHSRDSGLRRLPLQSRQFAVSIKRTARFLSVALSVVAKVCIT